jgi:superfamily II DNA or RNA helicase
VTESGPTPALTDVRLDSGYTTSRSDLIADFYLPCLATAERYDRASGYFRSTLFYLTSVGLSDFALRGGKMRLVCSPSLSREDVATLTEVLPRDEELDELVRREVELLLADPTSRTHTELLAALLAYGTLDVRIATPAAVNGIFHDKLGIFWDGEKNCVSFTGSANETFSAWDIDRNHESIEVFRSWDTSDARRIDRHAAYFESLWRNREPGVEVREFPAAAREILEYALVDDDLEAAVARFRAARRSKRQDGSVTRRPVFEQYQTAVIDHFFEAGSGLVAHATGAGKTLTGLEIIRRWIIDGRPALIIVPSNLLAMQWAGEADRYLGDLDVAFIQAGGTTPTRDWQALLPDMTRNARNLGGRVVIATLQTASRPAFLERVIATDDLLIVIDEVHRAGAASARSVFTIDAGGRLGLSATPERYGDPEGTAAIFRYFGSILEPVVTLKDAIGAGRLVEYDYFVHTVELTESEAEDWLRMTKEIQTAYARLAEDNHGKKIPSDLFQRLLIARARIVKQAERKTALAAEVVREEWRDGDRWLVYCDSQTQLTKVLEELRHTGLDAYEYHSAMAGGQRETLAYFERQGGVLVAIRCLDEGVDIPAANAALVLASSTNPREFIQRRGRVLRKAQGKDHATIHDCVVTLTDEEGRTRAIDADFARAKAFAVDARNPSTMRHLEMLEIELRAAMGGDFEDEDDD